MGVGDSVCGAIPHLSPLGVCHLEELVCLLEIERARQSERAGGEKGWGD